MNIPSNIAIIMDGNGRWAAKHFLPRTAGHYQGTKNIRNITICANDLGVKSLTLYAFSTENWKRSKEEVEYIMHLPAEFFDQHIEELNQNGVRIKLIGERDRLPKYALDPIESAENITKNNQGLLLNLCLNYGGRKEIELAIKHIIDDNINSNEVNEALISKYMQCNEVSDIDLLIRTSGEARISNFLLWQIAYAELCFVDKLWPDFNENDFKACIEDYSHRNRRFGGR